MAIAQSISERPKSGRFIDDGQWKIDDISGASDGEAWSIREMLGGSVKN